jgi:membrane protease YdiL (CAAX protease family)
MSAVVIVLAFPLILAAGYGFAFVLSGRDQRVLSGPVGFALYLVLLAIPLAAVLVERPELPGEVLGTGAWLPAWMMVGLAGGVALWVLQVAVFLRTPSDSSSPVWVGPPGWIGFAFLLAPVTGIVVAEELIWRGYLSAEIGLLLSAAAFALHHYHFGWRHIGFAFLAGLSWGALFGAAENLWPSIASHLLYNALAWSYLRRRAGSPLLRRCRPDGVAEGADSC